MTTSDKRLCFVRQNLKNGYHIKKLQNLISSYETATNWWQKVGDELWTRLWPLTRYTAKPIDVLVCAFFNIKFFKNYTRTSKQKFPFMLEAKKGYLSTPTMSYSCMHIAQFRHTKSLTKVVPSYKVAGFHITAPLTIYIHNIQKIYFYQASL